MSLKDATYLYQRMLEGHKVEVFSYLRSLPEEERNVLKKQIKTLTIQGEKKKPIQSENQTSGTKPSISPSPRPVSTNQPTSPRPSAPNPETLQLETSGETPKNVGQYQIGELLGKGAFGRVFKGLDTKNGIFVAVKQIEKALISESQLPSIMREAELLQRLDHPNIVKFYQYIETKSYLYFILEFVESGSLYKVMKKYGVFPEGLLSMYVYQMLTGLAYLHQKEIIHRDVKGANILLTKSGMCKLADFGSCTTAAIDKKYTVVGTPYWMAPEIIQMSGGDTSADIWSLGCTVIELLTGDPPYYQMGSMAALFRMAEDDHPPLPPSISSSLKEFLLKCFTKDPSKRPSASLLLETQWIIERPQQSIETNRGQEDDTGLKEVYRTVREFNTKVSRSGIGNIEWGQSSSGSSSSPSSLNSSSSSSTEESILKLLEKLEQEREGVRQNVEELKRRFGIITRERDHLLNAKIELQKAIDEVNDEKQILSEEVNQLKDKLTISEAELQTLTDQRAILNEKKMKKGFKKTH